MNFFVIFMKKIKAYTRILFMWFFHRIYGIDNNKVVFSSFYGKQYSDSGRAICEYLHNMNRDLNLVWLLNDDAIKDKYGIIPDYVVRKSNSFLSLAKEISTAKVYIINETIDNIYKSKGQLFINTWHGDRGFKKILYEAYENGKRPIPVYDNMLIDYCVAASDFGEERYRKAFNYCGKIIKVGMPRNDFFINGNKNIKEIKERFNIHDEKILLYAPTFRDKNSNIQTTDIDFNKILSLLSSDGSKWKIIIRSHPSSKGLNINVDKNKVLNLTDYPDMADILAITDFLLTDYSSSAPDFALTGRPIILYLYDYDEYKIECREFMADPKNVGFLYATSENELLDLISRVSNNEYKKSCKKVNDYYNVCETGKSTEYICKIIMDFINK